MTDQFEVFDATGLVLKKGTNLVEASAGTGKTYAISMLVLRSVVEHKVPIDRILVVTFTRAAAEELRGRVRARLVEARDLLAGVLHTKADETLQSWAATITDRGKALDRLQLALYDIDRASIFTIHGFCQRMLAEQALESSQLFDVELLTDIDQVCNEVVEDYWRNHIYRLDPLACAILTGPFPTPGVLYDSVSLARRSSGAIEPKVGDQDEAAEALAEAMRGIGLWWRAHGESLGEQFRDAVTQNHFKKKVYDGFHQWFADCSAFFLGESLLVPPRLELLSNSGLEEALNGNKFRGAEKKSLYMDGWNLPDVEITSLKLAIDRLQLTFRVALADELQGEVSRRLLQQGTMGFDDLIRNLSGGLRGERGAALTRVLAERFDVALIDEFQDTDSDQYYIFSTLFGGGSHYLYLIGDPKQAIYRFRGADIHSYFQARKAADSLLTLETNYRSHPGLVAEVNRLFSARDEPFLYERGILDYHPVAAAKKADQMVFERDGKNLAGMVYCSLPCHWESKDGRWFSGEAKELFRGYVVTEIVDLLQAQRPVLLRGEEDRPLAPRDIAILVRTNREAEEYRDALVQARIPALVASRKSVFSTTECRELLLLLQAICFPTEVAKLKAAMTVSWFGLSGNELYTIWRDDQRFSFWQGKMIEYRSLWQQQGFLTMMSSLLVREEVLLTLAGTRSVERSVANIHQLLELVQEQETSEKTGISQLLTWLQSMHSGDSFSGDGELLLESDEQAVQIVTMHSAKGLEYPVVFCPVLWSGSDYATGEKYQVSSHDGDQQPVVDLGSELFEQRKSEARREQMAEDLRLLYVALTRARLRCYTLWGDVRGHGKTFDSFDSALGYLLFPRGKCSHGEQSEVLDQLAAGSLVVHIPIDSEAKGAVSTLQREQLDLQPRKGAVRSLQTDWQMTSFSAMTALSEYAHEGQPGLLRSTDRDTRPIPVSGLPAGASFGNVVHDLLERFSFRELEESEELGDACATICSKYGVQADPLLLTRLLLNVAGAQLPFGFSLAGLGQGRCLKEMNFYFQLSPVQTGGINHLLAKEPTVLPLGHRRMRGYLTGFVDLICEHQGKYYIIDYKTNYLGDFLDAYQPENLIPVMQEHNYGLQYWMYTLVLHRHLQNIIPDYSYGSHFGGVMYLFVRGMSLDDTGTGVFTDLPDQNILQRLDRLMGGEEHV